jgi:DNA modification methylase
MIYNQDCLEYLKTIPDKYFQTVVTSPPYNQNKYEGDNKSTLGYLAYHQHRLLQLKRVLKDNGSIFWQVGNLVFDGEIVPLDILFYDIFKSLGFKLRNRIIWHFAHGLHCKHRFSGRYETILFFTKSDDYVFNLDNVRIPAKYPKKKYYKGPKKGQYSCNPLGCNPGDKWEVVCKDWEKEVWSIPNVKHNHPEKTIHPCQFPVELAERCILAASNEGDCVYDPFCGTGSTVIAAKMNKRIGFGTDISKEFCDIAQKRLVALDGNDLKLRSMNKPIYQGI